MLCLHEYFKMYIQPLMHQEWCFFACLSNILLCIKCSRTQLVYPNANAYAFNCLRTYPFLAHPTLVHLLWYTSYASNTRAFMWWGCLSKGRATKGTTMLREPVLPSSKLSCTYLKRTSGSAYHSLLRPLCYFTCLHQANYWNPVRLQTKRAKNMVNNLNIVQVSANHL